MKMQACLSGPLRAQGVFRAHNSDGTCSAGSDGVRSRSAIFPEEKPANFVKNKAAEERGQPDELSPCYVLLASDDAHYMRGQVLHPHGGCVVNG
jgi:hypothetical protein